MKFWSQAAQPDPEHPYLARKKIKAHGIRQLNEKLVIPLRDADGKLWSVEFISPDGAKRFLSGGRKRGCYFGMGCVAPERGEFCIAEGFATGASIHEATGKAVAVAFDAGNLEPVARVLRAKFPGAVITICADNDTSTPGNPGLTKATLAARAVGGYVAIPPHGYNDFNDAAVAEVVE
ncbi:MAG: toprim domain-containing protein [Rhodanobacteraceae bacterium]